MTSEKRRYILVLGSAMVVFIASFGLFLKRTDFIFPWHLWTWRLPASLVAPLIGIPIAAASARGGVLSEVKSLVFMPGFIAGGIVGCALVNSWSMTMLSLVPCGIALLGVIALALALSSGGVHGPYFQFLLLPCLVSIPYSYLGSIIGWAMRLTVIRLRKPPVAAVVVLLLLSGKAAAWDDQVGHPYIVERSIVVLDRAEPGKFREAKAFDGVIRNGAKEEDSPALRVLEHFHNPATTRSIKGLYVARPEFGPNLSSIDKAASLWSIAQEQYKINQKVQAYIYLGRIAHLITGDAYQPGHVHDDPHTYAWLQGDAQTIEDRFRDNTAAVTTLGLNPTSFPQLTESGLIGIGNAATMASY